MGQRGELLRVQDSGVEPQVDCGIYDAVQFCFSQQRSRFSICLRHGRRHQCRSLVSDRDRDLRGVGLIEAGSSKGLLEYDEIRRVNVAVSIQHQGAVRNIGLDRVRGRRQERVISRDIAGQQRIFVGGINIITGIVNRAIFNC